MKLAITTLLILASFAGFAQNSALKHHKVKVVALGKVQGYLEHLPPGYDSNPTKKYPLLIFLHGAGERGTSPSDLYKAAKLGPPHEVEQQGSLCFNVNGKQECFIVISPQLTGNGNWTGYAQKEFWDYILHGPNNYRYDPNRIYLTGLSLGGNGVWERAYDDANGPNILAAIAPLCSWGNTTKGPIVANRQIPVWAFHGTDDHTIGFNSGLAMFNSVNDAPGYAAEGKFTAIQGADHWIWGDVYKTDHSVYSQNVYEWLLTKTLNNSGTGGGDNSTITNQPPVVNAGQDANTNVGADAMYFTAQASDPDGSISTFKWTKVSGPSVTLWNTDRAKLTAVNFVAGTYEFKVTVTDNKGAQASDKVLLNVTSGTSSGSGTNQLPTVDAGADVNASVTDDAIYLIARGSDPDGNIASFNWKKVSGPSVNLWNTDRAKLTLKNFVAGTYVLQVTAKDNSGGTATDQVQVNVSSNSFTGTTASIQNKTSTDGMPYLEYLPSGYTQSKKYPVIVYLHSEYAEGSNLDLIKNEGPMYFANQGKEIAANGESFIVLSPQVAKGSGFWKGKIDRFYDYLVSKYPADKNRIYLVGYDGGAIDGLYRLMDGTNKPNRWAAAAAISYSMPLSVACSIAGSGPALYMANGTMDAKYNYQDALAFYNKVDNCTSGTTKFVSESGSQDQSWKRSFDPGITNLYAWLLNQSINYQASASSARTSGETAPVIEETYTDRNLASVEKNFQTGDNELSLISESQPVQIEVKSIDGRTVKSVNSTGDISLEGIDNGMYLYTVVDDSSTPLQTGRIVKYSR